MQEECWEEEQRRPWLGREATKLFSPCMRSGRMSEAQWPILIISLGKLSHNPRRSVTRFLSSYCAIPLCFPFCSLPFGQPSHFYLQKVGEEFSFQSVLASAPNTDCFWVSRARRFMEKALSISFFPPCLHTSLS